jgi:hypothetical protein
VTRLDRAEELLAAIRRRLEVAVRLAARARLELAADLWNHEILTGAEARAREAAMMASDTIGPIETMRLIGIWNQDEAARYSSGDTPVPHTSATIEGTI